MNKTVNINIGGLFFHIDEDAYQKLSRYFDAIKRSLSNSSGKDEIMKDIEMRVAEIFSERQKSDKHVINLRDVDEVVAVMGQPEDYRIDEEENANSSTSSIFNTAKNKKLYRDKEHGMIGGVCTGLGHYFGIDVVWIRIVFLLLLWAGGTGVIAYFILWVAAPEAITTSEKLEMTGEPVNISNIEKKVREEFDNVSNKIKNVDYDKMGNQIKSTTESVGGKLGDVLISIFKVFAKVLGVFILMISSISLLAFAVVSIVMMFSSTLPSTYILNHFHTPISFDTPLWIQGILYLLVFGIPLFFLVILGVKLISSNIKPLNNSIKYSMLALWVVALGIFISLLVKDFSLRANEGKIVKKEFINYNVADTLFIKFKTNDYFNRDSFRHTDYEVTQDEKGHQVVYSNNIEIKVLATDETVPYLQIEKYSNGRTVLEANQSAAKINYNYKIEGNKIILDNYFLSSLNSINSDQKVELYLYLPKGTMFKADKNIQDYDESDNEFFNLHFSSSDYVYKVGDSQVKCLNCPADENDYDDVESDFKTEDINVIDENDSTKTISVKINGNVVRETKEGKTKEDAGSLIINKDGIIIKTK